MKIYFCDICNQSIPLKDLDDGLAVAVKGKLVCAACSASAAAAKSAAAPVAAPAGSIGRDLALVAVAAALGIAGAWWLLGDRQRQLEGRLASLATGSSQRSGEVESRAASLSGEIAGLRGSIESLRADLDARALEDGARRRGDRAETEARFEALKHYLKDLETLKERVQELEVRSAASSEAASLSQGDLAALRASVTELAAAVGKLSSGGLAPGPAKPADEGAAAAPSNPSLPPLPKDLQDVARNLKSGDAGLRWEAVDKLGASRDARVVPYLIPSLGDSDDFVRRQAAEVLGDLNAKAAVGPLIDALLDDQLHVRDSVIAALRKITGQNIKYEPLAKKEDRQKQQRLWRTWLEQNQEKFQQNP